MAKPYYWVEGKDLREQGFFDMVDEMGADQMRLEFHPGDENPYRWVNRETGEMCGEYDIVFTCPPTCA